jgi:phospholipase/carboxylesterase/glyoxalase family protein
MIEDFVHRFVAGGSADAPTLLLLHGTGGTEDDLLNLGRMLIPDAALLSPRGRVLENGMPRFFRRLAEGVFDQEDLHRRTHELAAFVQAASAEYHFDPMRVVAVGYSNGANIAASLFLLHPETLSAGILLRPMIPFVPEQRPDLSRKTIFISAGRTDPLIPQAQTEQLVTLLRQSGAQVETHWLNGGHAISHEDVRAARSWLQTQKL